MSPEPLTDSLALPWPMNGLYIWIIWRSSVAVSLVFGACLGDMMAASRLLVVMIPCVGFLAGTGDE